MPHKSFDNMHVIDVYPIARGVPFETLSYFSTASCKTGSVVTVPFRNNDTPAVVESVSSAQESKVMIKSADYTLQKLPDQTEYKLFTQDFIAAAKEVADFFATTPGAVFYALTPQAILKNIKEHNLKDEPTQENTEQTPPRIIQASRKERFEIFEEIYSNEKDGATVIFLSPTVTRAQQLHQYMQDRLDTAPTTLHSDLSDKQIQKQWNTAVSNSESVITTPSFLSIPLESVTAIVCEQDGSDANKQQHRPHLDFRTTAKILSEHYSAELVYADTVVRPSTYKLHIDEKAGENDSITDSYESDAREILVDMKTHADETDDGFAALSDPITDILSEETGRVFLLVGRVGLNPFTVCGDCGETLLCKNCNTPLTLKESSAGREFVCNRCGSKQQSDTVCDKCGSWKLWALGVGTDSVREEISENFPHRDVFQIDSDTTTTRKQVQKTIDKFYESESGVLVGTQLSIGLLESVNTVGIASIDSQLSIPDFRVSERVFRLLTQLRIKAADNFILQTRSGQTEVLKHALRGDVVEFLISELEKREKFEYPPFRLLIRITVTDFEDNLKKKMQHVANKITKYPTQNYPAFDDKHGGKKRRHLLVRVPPGSWPDAELITLLRDLDSDYTIDIEPQSII